MQELAVLASRVLTTQKQFTAVADNVANVNTPGYRKLDMSFKEIVSRPQGKATASYVEDRAITFNPDQGTLQSTGNQLDIALGGPGFFAVSVGNATQYTRRGQFVLNSEGTLVTPEGNPVLDNAGAQIQFPEGTTTINVASDGTISTKDGQLAQLGVYVFTPEQESSLQRAGTTAFSAPGGVNPQVVETPTVRQGFIEASNVNAVEEMVSMQAVSKAYENSVNMMRNLEDLEQRTIRTLGNQ